MILRLRSLLLLVLGLCFATAILTPAGYAQTPSAGTLDTTFYSAAVNSVFATAVQPDGKIIIGGSFVSVSGVVSHRIARLHPNGSVDTSFHPVLDRVVNCVAVQSDGKILLGGDFTSIGPTPRGKLARLHPDGSLDTSFDPQVDNTVRCIFVQPDGTILIGGDFQTVKSTTRRNFARLNADGSLDSSFNPNPDGPVYCTAVQANGEILIGGDFTLVGGLNRTYAARLEADGTVDPAFNSQINGVVNCILPRANGRVLIAGNFTIAGGISNGRIAELFSNGGEYNVFNCTMNGEVSTLVEQADGLILVGGHFTTANGTSRLRVARVSRFGSLDEEFNTAVDGPVHTLALQGDGSLLIGGDFSNVNEKPRFRLARVHTGVAYHELKVLDASSVRWNRAGAVPEARAVTFESSMDGGATWTFESNGSKITLGEPGWSAEGGSLPTHGILRARAYTGGGLNGGSAGIVEALRPFAFIPVPSVAPRALGEISWNSATLRANVWPARYETEVWFEYGTTTAYGQSTAPQTLENADKVMVATQVISGLQALKTYHFRVVARNANGTVYGLDDTFTTPNAPPVAVNETYHLPLGLLIDGSFALRVLHNDSDPDGDNLTLLSYTQGSRGSITAGPDGTLLYSPGDAFDGNDSFTYTITDPYGSQSTATVTLVNGHPDVRNDSYHPAAGMAPQPYQVAGVNTDPDSDDLLIVAVTQGSKGAVSMDGIRVVYTPGEGYDGNDSFTYTVIDGYGGTSTSTISLVNAAPVAQADTVKVVRASRSLSVLANDSDPDGDTLTVSAVTDGAFGSVSTDGTTVTYTPGLAFRNSDSFTYTVNDGRGKSATASVTVVLERLVTEYVAAEKTSVPGAVQDTSFASFGIPSMNRRGAVAFVAKMKSPEGRVKAGVFAGSPAALLVQAGDDAPGIDGGVFRAFNPPALNDAGHVAFIASVSGVSKKTDSGIWSTRSGTLALVAQEGLEAPGVDGAKFSRFDSFVLPATGRVVFVAALARGAGGVTDKNDLGVWAEQEDGTLLLLVREKDKVFIGEDERTVKTISAFAALSGSAGQRRSFNVIGDLLLRLGFVDGSKALVRVTPKGVFHEVVVNGDVLPNTKEAKVSGFGLGTLSNDGGAIFRATLKREKGIVSERDDEVILAGSGIGNFQVRARAGGAVANVPEVLLRSLKDPVGNAGGNAAFIATLVPGKGGVTSRNDTAICLAPGGSPWMLVQEGDEAPGADGRKFAGFESLVYPDDRGVAFVATLGPEPGSAKRAGEKGLWALDKDRVLHLLVREGEKLQVDGVEKQLKKFTVLSAVASSPSQGGSYSGNGGFAYRAMFTDGTEGVFTVWVP